VRYLQQVGCNNTRILKHMKILNYTLQVAAAVSIATAVESWAGDSGAVASADAGVSVNVLSSVPAEEVPAKAAQLVARADAAHQPLVTSEAVKEALLVNPGATTLVVGSIARQVPSMAANAALAAVTVEPYQVTAIARAAATAAPQKAAEIVKVLCRAVPSSYRAIAETVASVVPGATKEILNAVAEAIPSLKATIAEAMAANQGSYLTVYSVLAQIGDLSMTGIDTESSGTRAFKKSISPVAPTQIAPSVPPAAGNVVPVSGQTDSTLQ
jgi:hypothetical protein